MDVRLSPVIYIRRPEYWRIEVVGILSGFGLPALAPYHVTIPLDGVIGTAGIEVVGANKTQLIDIFDTVELCNENKSVRYRANQVPGGVIIIAEGEHNTSGYEVFFTQSPLDIYPPQFILNHEKKGEIVLEVITPFCVWTSFHASEKIEKVTVHDAQGAHEINVEQTPD